MREGDRSLPNQWLEEDRDGEDASEDAPTVLMSPEALAAELQGSLAEATVETPAPAPQKAVHPVPVAAPRPPAAPSISPMPLQSRPAQAAPPAPEPTPEPEVSTGPPWMMVAGAVVVAVPVIGAVVWGLTRV